MQTLSGTTLASAAVAVNPAPVPPDPSKPVSTITFGDQTGPTIIYHVGEERVIDLPEASDALGSITYTVSPKLPDGLTVID